MTYDRRGLLVLAEQTLLGAPATTMAALARRCGVSLRTLRRAVQGERGTNFRHWRRTLLAARAEAMLTGQPSASIKEVAFALGFVSQQTFARRCREATGRTPTEVRHSGPRDRPQDERSHAPGSAGTHLAGGGLAPRSPRRACE